MPWRYTSAMEERYQFVKDAKAYLGDFTELCAHYGISTKTGYKWMARYERGGIGCLQDQSRAPKSHPNQVSLEIKEAILQARRAHATWGPKKLRVLLQRANPKQLWPSRIINMPHLPHLGGRSNVVSESGRQNLPAFDFMDFVLQYSP